MESNRGLFGYEGEGFVGQPDPDPDDLDRARRDDFGARPYGERDGESDDASDACDKTTD
jgi:hypothetical protein